MLRVYLTLILAILLLILQAPHRCQAAFDPKDPRVEDRLAIADLVTKYCTAVDQRDFKKFKELFTQDAVLDYSANWGQGSGHVNVMAKQLEDALSLFSASIHFWSNLDIEFTGPNSAKARYLLDNPMFLKGLPRVALLTIYGYYNHELVKDANGVWRSKHMSMEITSPFEHQLLVLIVIIVLLWRTRRRHN